MEILYAVLAGFGGLLFGALLVNFVLASKSRKVIADSDNLIEKARKDAEKIVKDAKEERNLMISQLKEQEKEKKNNLRNVEARLVKKEQDIENKIEDLDAKKVKIESEIKKVEEDKRKFEENLKAQEDELERIASLSKEDAKNELVKKVEEEFQPHLVGYVEKMEEEAKMKASEKAKAIMVTAMQKYASETATESTATIVQLPSDEMKGRIIGREGRNINTFEHMTGVDVIVDDTPGTVIIAGFDLLRRYIAKVSLERLVTDGRIHPGRIEEVVTKVKSEVSSLIKGLGEKAAFEVGVVGLNSDVVNLLGRLKFKTSYGQNLLKQSVEIANLAGIMAAEIGADVSLVKRAGLLHAIGRSVDHEVSGNFFQVGADICRKYGMSEKLVEIIENMQDMKDQKSAEGALVEAAYLLSCNRPGVDKNNLESYVKRMEDLENIAKSFDGVTGAYAIHTGTEVKVLVDAEKIDDLKTMRLSHEIARKIEEDTQFSGRVKVTVLREKRIEATAE